VTIGHWDDQS